MITEQVLDSLLPAEMAKKAESVGVVKGNMGLTKTLTLALLAGAFIALGAVFSTTVTAGSTLPFGVTKLLAGLVFSLGLILVVVGGAELFTGNNLIIMAWAKRLSTNRCSKTEDWSISAISRVLSRWSLLMLLSEQYKFGNGAIGANMLAIANAKCQLHFIQAIALGILCNILVCLAVWLCFSATSITGKIAGILFPISAFVAAGFEHSVANMYFIPAGILLKEWASPDFWLQINATPLSFTDLNWTYFFVNNLLPVTIGNIIGGAVLVGLVYWFVFLKPERQSEKFTTNH